MKINPMIVFRKEFDGTGLLFNPENGDTFALNSCAAAIFEWLVAGNNREQILGKLAEQTDLPEQAAADLDDFLRDLTTQGYLAAE